MHPGLYTSYSHLQAFSLENLFFSCWPVEIMLMLLESAQVPLSEMHRGKWIGEEIRPRSFSNNRIYLVSITESVLFVLFLFGKKYRNKSLETLFLHSSIRTVLTFWEPGQQELFAVRYDWSFPSMVPSYELCFCLRNTSTSRRHGENIEPLKQFVNLHKNLLL
jgi:hypothetical protein